MKKTLIFLRISIFKILNVAAQPAFNYLNNRIFHRSVFLAPNRSAPNMSTTS